MNCICLNHIIVNLTCFSEITGKGFSGDVEELRDLATKVKEDGGYAHIRGDSIDDFVFIMQTCKFELFPKPSYQFCFND